MEEDNSDFWKLFTQCQKARLIPLDARPAVYRLFVDLGKGQISDAPGVAVPGLVTPATSQTVCAGAF